MNLSKPFRIRNWALLNLFSNSNNNSTQSDDKSNSNANVSNVPLKNPSAKRLTWYYCCRNGCKQKIYIDSILAPLKTKVTTSMLSPSRTHSDNKSNSNANVSNVPLKNPSTKRLTWYYCYRYDCNK